MLGPLGTGRGLANPQTHDRALGQTVWAYGSGLKNFGSTGPRFLGMGVADSINHAPPHVCYRTKYRRCRSSHFGVSRCPKNLEDALIFLRPSALQEF